METTDYQKKKKEFAKLKVEQIYTQRQIAKKVGISEVTASKWSLELKKDSNQLKIMRKKLLFRIDEAINNANSSSSEIHNYTTALSVLSKQIEKAGLYG
jgi:DNA-binding XRE family transcriptional regulator